MKRVTSFSVVLIIILATCMTAFSQERAKKADYKLIHDDSSYEMGTKTYFFDYEFKGVPVKTVERYFRSKEEQDDGLVEMAKRYDGCGIKSDLFNNTGRIIGKRITCDDTASKKFVIIYCFFDSLNKVNVILAESQKVVEDFAKGICPYAYQLYGDPICPVFDDEMPQ